MAPDALAQVLRPLEQMFTPERFPQLLVGLARADDAAVYQVAPDLALIATLDFITPIVDDPRDFGAIAAANSMSDVYAMGGRVVLALNVACLSSCLPADVIVEVLRGGAEKVAEAGAVLAGGHSVDDKEPKYGLVALGLAHPDRIWRKGGARPGDVLVLTKPLGVGIVTTAAKRNQARPNDLAAATASMLRLNRRAAELLQTRAVHACTDITGFALLGHASEMALSGDVRLRFHLERLPFLPGAVDYARAALFPGGTKRNQRGFAERVAPFAGLEEHLERLLYTPETSGGLLAAVPAGAVSELKQAFAAAGEDLWVVGEAVAGSPAVEIASDPRLPE